MSGNGADATMRNSEHAQGGSAASRSATRRSRANREEATATTEAKSRSRDKNDNQEESPVRLDTSKIANRECEGISPESGRMGESAHEESSYNADLPAMGDLASEMMTDTEQEPEAEPNDDTSYDPMTQEPEIMGSIECDDEPHEEEGSSIATPSRVGSLASKFGNVMFAGALSACLAATSGAWACGPDIVEGMRESATAASAYGAEEDIAQDNVPLAEFELPVEDEPYVEPSTERKLDSLSQVRFEKREIPASEPSPDASGDQGPSAAQQGEEQVLADPGYAELDASQASAGASWEASQFAGMTQADFAGKTTAQKIELIGAMARQDMHESGILASITAAQAILESGWMESGLAKRNNLFGIKASNKVNAWEGTTWTGTYVELKTSEEYVEGEYTVITAKFRTYPSVWASIKDHSAYLANCYNGSHKRYEGIVGCTNPRTGFQIIKDGGYATSSTYVDNLMRVVEKYGLTRFDS